MHFLKITSPNPGIDRILFLEKYGLRVGFEPLFLLPILPSQTRSRV
jgi:hypothetical protein